jgi:uncharacterized protein (TIGR02217 family)
VSSAVFPTLPGLTYDIQRVPTWKTKVQQSVSGREVRGAFMSAPLYSFTLTFEFLRSNALAELQTLVAFFNARQGSYDSFLYSDPVDNNVTQQSLGTGTGTQTTFQLLRSFGVNIEPVCNVNTITGVYLNGVSTSAYSISATGLITFTTAPGAGVAVTWTGSYYYRCRFTQDTAEFENFMQDLWSLKKIEFLANLGNRL